MGRKKIIYFGLLFILMVISTITYFSYGFLIKTDEYHGKLNMIVGTLDYKITSDDLTNNQITVEPGKKEITIKIKSLNKIDSKYQLYYQAPTGVVVGYSDTNTSLGTINANEEKEIALLIDNTTSSNQTVTFGAEGGFIGNNLVLSQGTAIIEKINICPYTKDQEFTFDYTGNVQTFTPECDGIYKLETWGAQGGSISNYTGGYGGYSVGYIDLKSSNTIYIGVGQAGSNGNNASIAAYNGGGTGSTTGGTSGGGATHMAFVDGTIANIGYDSFITNSNGIIVAGGGGGAVYYSEVSQYASGSGGHGGGKTGVNGFYVGNWSSKTGQGGTQTSGGNYGYCNANEICGSAGVFGQGGSKINCSNSNCDGNYQAGGGGGLYGGGSTRHDGAGGGSGYIANTNLINKYMYCYGCSESTDISTYTVSTTGSSSLRDTTNCPNGYSSNPISKCAKAGNGYAKITYLGE